MKSTKFTIGKATIAGEGVDHRPTVQWITEKFGDPGASNRWFLRAYKKVGHTYIVNKTKRTAYDIYYNVYFKNKDDALIFALTQP